MNSLRILIISLILTIPAMAVPPFKLLWNPPGSTAVHHYSVMKKTTALGTDVWEEIATTPGATTTMLLPPLTAGENVFVVAAMDASGSIIGFTNEATVQGGMNLRVIVEFTPAQ